MTCDCGDSECPSCGFLQGTLPGGTCEVEGCWRAPSPLSGICEWHETGPGSPAQVQPEAFYLAGEARRAAGHLQERIAEGEDGGAAFLVLAGAVDALRRHVKP